MARDHMRQSGAYAISGTTLGLVTRLSEYFLPTERQPPADAEATSHKLMVRAGLIRQVGAGLWSFLPAGWRVHQRAVQIVREEIDAIGGQEMLMPVLQPAEPWRRTGRYAIEELFKLEDRRGADLVLGMTHEEVITLHVAQSVRSYRDLPLILYQFQTKELDEPRPRAGVLPKACPVGVEDRGMVMAVVGGQHRVNEVKLRHALGAAFRPAHAEEGAEGIGPVGFIGPVGADVPVLLDEGVGVGGYVTGGNRADLHLRGVEPGRDFAFERADIRRVEPGDRVDGRAIRIEAAIEVGNISKLGTRYSEAPGATYLDEPGRERPTWMGSYGSGPARIAAAAVEQNADEHGIAWPRPLAPFDVHLVGLGQPGSEERAHAD